MTELNQAARAVIASGKLAHLVTVNGDGSPQVSLVWTGMDGDDLVAAHLNPAQQKLRNIRRDPRVVISMEAGTRNDHGLDEYLVLTGTARLQEGGAPELLQQLAEVYLGPGVKFPPMEDPPPGVVTRISVDRVSGIGPWTD